MNKQTDNSGTGPRRGVRPVVFIGLLAGVGLLVLAGVLFFKHKSAPPGEQGRAELAANPAVTSSSAPGAPEGTPQANPQSASTPAPAQTLPAVPSTDAQAAGQPSLQDLIKTLMDPSQSLKARKEAIAALAKNGSAEALAALKDALKTGSDELRAAVAEGLGECASAECTAMLLGLLNDPNQAIVQAAIRGLAQQGSPQAVEALTKLLYDPLRANAIRGEAATGLGTIQQPGALETLSQAALTLNDNDLVTQVLDAIGTRDFNETQAFFQNYLHSPNASSELRVAAVESLARAQGDPSAFLVSLASDVDADVRAAAGWAMSATDVSGNSGAQLISLLQSEQDPEVRRRLYQALRNQESYDPALALAAVQKESDPEARVAGMGTLAKALLSNPSPDLQSFFEQTAAPELVKLSLNGQTPHERMAPVVALVYAGNYAVPAMQELAQNSPDPRIKDSALKFLARAQTAASK